MESRIYYGEYILKRWIDLLLKGNIILPEYQRYFVWEKDDVERLIQSIKDGQFVPQITIARYDTENEKKNLILDGQQRLTSILLSYLGYFPNKSEFYSYTSPTEDDSELDEDESVNKEVTKIPIRWTFQELIKAGHTKEEIVSKLREDEKKYTKFSITLEDSFFKEHFIGFSYIVPKSDKEEEIRRYFSQTFRSINYYGKSLTNEESRKALYYMNTQFTNYFEGYFENDGRKRVLEGLHIGQGAITNGNDIDLIRYLSILSQLIALEEKNEEYRRHYVLQGYAAYRAREEFYTDYVAYLLGLPQEKREDKFIGFKFAEFFGEKGEKLNKCFKALREELEKLKPSVKQSGHTFSSWTEADYWLFGLIYHVFFYGKRLSGEVEELQKKISNRITSKTKELNYTKNSNRLNNIRERFWESIKLYSDYVS